MTLKIAVLVKQVPDLEAVVQVKSATELDIEAQEILRLRKHLYEIIAKHTGQDVDTIETDCDRNKWLTAEDAIAYGCIDQIFERMPEAPLEE